MRKNVIISIVVLFIFLPIIGCKSVPSQSGDMEGGQVKLTVAAAASLVDALDELKIMYGEKNPDIILTYNLASSGTLQKQIEEGAPVDVFISAGKSQMDALDDKGLVIKDSLTNLLGNQLVLIASAQSNIESFDDLATDLVNKISIGTPETVPAGKYAQETLINLNLWDNIQPKIVMANDVRQVLTLVETTNVEAGLVYSSDAIQGKDIKIVATPPAKACKPIVYPMAIMASSKHIEEAQNFQAFLLSDEAMEVFIKYGFINIKN